MSKNIEFLIRPGQLIRVPRTAVKGACGSYSLLYRVNDVRDKWHVRVTRLDQHAPKKPHTTVSMLWLWRGKVVRSGVEVPSRLLWDMPLSWQYEWALVHNPHWAQELEQEHG